jgi:glycogen debranching enzyme
LNIDPILKIKARSPILNDHQKVLPQSEGAVVRDDYIHLPLDGLSILTLVSKWMGPLEGWAKHFDEAKVRGYTMVHYTPLQERGVSDSPYSIRDQMKYDSSLFGTKLTGGAERTKVEDTLKLAREKYGLLSLTDVVLNHTANDSEWLVDHPEAGMTSDSSHLFLINPITGFSPANTPHLTPALELDTAILEFSSSLAARGLPTIVTSEEDVERLISAFHDVIEGLDLWQYYVLNPAWETESVKAALRSKKDVPWAGPNVSGKSAVELAQVLRAEKKVEGLGGLASRFGVKVDSTIAAGLVKAALGASQDVDAMSEVWKNVVDVINVPLYEEWKEDQRVALDNMRNRVKYTRLDPLGPKLGEISETQVPQPRCSPFDLT